MVCDSVRSCVTTSPVAADRPTDLNFAGNFGMYMDISDQIPMRGVPFHVYYIHFSQCAHPMGSGRPQWAAGEYLIFIKNII